MLWMTTLLGMLIMGAAEFTSSDHEPEDEAAEPEEPQTVDHADPAQFYSGWTCRALVPPHVLV